MKPPGPLARGPGLCPRGGVVAVPLPDSVSWARPHRSWGLAFPLPFWRWRKLCRRGGGGWTRSVLNERGPQAVLPVGRGGGGVFRAGAFGPGPKNKPAAGQSPAAGGWAAPTRRRPPRWIFHQRQVERRGKGAPGSFMVRLACIDLAGPVELFQQHHPKELVGKGGGTEGDTLIRPG